LDGLATCARIFDTTGAPNVIFGTKWPSITSIWIQVDLFSISIEHAAPRAAKSAERIEGAIIAGGVIVKRGLFRGRVGW
jgi:hypothetical protein